MLIHLNVSKFLNALTANTSILVVIEKIYRYQFKSNYLQNHKFVAAFFFAFLEFTLNPGVQKTPEICRKVLLSYFFIILSQIELEKIIFNQI